MKTQNQGRLERLCAELNQDKFEGEVYSVGNPESRHDIDLVVVYYTKNPATKFAQEAQMIERLRKVFGRKSRIFQDCQFDDYTARCSIHLLSYQDILKQESPYLVRSFFKNATPVYGEIRSNEYYFRAHSKILDEPYRARQYLNIAIKQIYHTITNPRSRLELLNSLISANHYACRTLEELNKQYSTGFSSEELEVVRKTKKQILGRKLKSSELNEKISVQKQVAEILLHELGLCYDQLQYKFQRGKNGK